MEIRVLGCSGGIGGLEQRTTALAVDDDILVDCGTGGALQSVEELMRIDHIFLTHAHLDHIAFLPFIVDSVGDYRRAPITVHGAPETLRILRSHVFNWLIWPDFSAIPDRSRPLIRTLAVSMVAVGAAGLVGLLASHWAEPWVERVIELVRRGG